MSSILQTAIVTSTNHHHENGEPDALEVGMSRVALEPSWNTTTSTATLNLPQSPVPLLAEEAQNDEVRELARKLAPALFEADELLSVPLEFRPSHSAASSGDEDDDNLDTEMQALQWSEELLRQELEMANNFSDLFTFSSQGLTPAEDENDQQKLQVKEPPQPSVVLVDPPDDPILLLSSNGRPEPTVDAHIPASEADMDENDQKSPEQSLETTPGLPPIRIPESTPESRIRSPSKKTATPGTRNSLFGPNDSVDYSEMDHLEHLKVAAEERGGWYSVDLTKCFYQGDTSSVGVAIKEYCLSIPDEKLRHLFVGLPELKTNDHKSPGPILPLPVRTLAIRIRPDVLCGAVMEAVHHALTELHAQVQKRQGGSIKAAFPPAVHVPRLSEEHSLSELAEEEAPSVPAPPPTHYPPFWADFQLTTFKSEECERMLLIRVYHVPPVAAASTEPGALEGPPASSPTCPLEEAINPRIAWQLREAAALIQRIELPDPAKRIHSPGSPSLAPRHVVEQTVSKHLLDHYRACPSVKGGEVTMPALNAEDFAVIVSSSRVVHALWEELETRELLFTNLTTSNFGAFPALPTLDVQYCSQMRRISRESMIVQLLRRASELEEYAREAEYACANMIALLKPSFDSYGVPPPSLPRPVPLTAYALNFTPPQATCPPWGQRVQQALNEIQAYVADLNKDSPPITSMLASEPIDSRQSVNMAKKAVRLVLAAFQRQDDEEQSARLERKNIQVMDRLAKMQSHQRASIEVLSLAPAASDRAAKALDEFTAKTGIREVPLLKWSIVVGSSTGSCTVTANHLLLVTQLIPLIGGSKTTLFRLADVQFACQELSQSILNPLPTSIIVKKDGREVYSFRPSMGGARLKSFLDIVKSTAAEAPLDLPTV